MTCLSDRISSWCDEGEQPHGSDLVQIRRIRKKKTDGRPALCLWRTLPVSMNNVYQTRIVSRNGGSLPYFPYECLPKISHICIMVFMSGIRYGLSVKSNISDTYHWLKVRALQILACSAMKLEFVTIPVSNVQKCCTRI
ncbi:hypothetical protein AVEN_139151-1 [Araneus ventricosus]|uniref:Uncharacterized protein n=1 Tax=Araneus ventricosus TaxID=182803 RepID=A0A4Y2JNQ0_ARAVE|nr:hypothetical protein AVEN_139151-1 [Araneus ventricosus]